TLPGFAAAFASALRARGIDAWALSEENQMELHFAGRDIPLRPLPRNFGTPPTRHQSTSQSEFLDFANVGEAIAATPAQLEKIRLLSDYLQGLTSEQLPIATTYFTGRAFAQSDLRILQVGWAVIFRVLQDATRIGNAEFHRVAGRHGDAGKTAFEVLDGRT